MCGRYLFKQEIDSKTEDFLNSLEDSVRQDLALQDVYPSNKTLVMGEDLKLEIMQWGLVKWDDKGLIINARTETLTESSFFKEHFKLRRCLIQAEGFYEWDTHKEKYLVKPVQKEPFYMAGLYTDEPHPRFCILTTASVGEFATLHSRIPLMIPHAYAKKYIDQGDLFLQDFKALKQIPLTWENQSIQARLF